MADEVSLLGLYFVGQDYFERGFEGVQIVEQEVAPHLAAKAWLDYRSVDIKTNPPKVSLLKELLENSDLDLKKFFNTSGNSYRELGLKNRFDTLTVDEALSLLSQDGKLIKRPILIKGDKVLQIGYRSP